MTADTVASPLADLQGPLAYWGPVGAPPHAVLAPTRIGPRLTPLQLAARDCLARSHRDVTTAIPRAA